MEALILKIGDILAGLGLSGIVIFGLTAACVTEFRIIMQLYGAREQDIRAILGAINDSTNAHKESTGTNKDLVSVLRQKLGIL